MGLPVQPPVWDEWGVEISIGSGNDLVGDCGVTIGQYRVQLSIDEVNNRSLDKWSNQVG